MKNEAQTERAPLRARQVVVQLQFHLHRVLVLGQTQSPRETSDVSVHGKTRKIEHHAAHHVARLAPDSGKCHEIIEITRHLSIEAFDQSIRHADEVLRLAAVETGRTNDAFQLADIGGRQRPWIGITREQSGGHHVHAGVGALRRQDGGRQQLEGVAMIEFADHVGECDGQTACHFHGLARRVDFRCLLDRHDPRVASGRLTR